MSICHSYLCLNPAVLPFYSSISFKISKIISRFGFKVSFKRVNENKIASAEDCISTENRGTYFIPCFSFNLDYINPARRRLKARLDEHPCKVKNEEICSSSILSNYQSYNHYLDFTKTCIASSLISTSYLNFHEAFYILINSDKFINDFCAIPSISDALKLLKQLFLAVFNFLSISLVFLYFFFFIL